MPKNDRALLHFWEHHFKRLKVRLVLRSEEDEAPDSNIVYVNAGDDYKKRYKGSHHVVFDGKESDQTMLGDTKLEYVAVLDSKYPGRRAFIGHFCGDQNNGLLGGICCFDDDGNMDRPLQPFRRSIFKIGFDGRCPAWDNLILCGDKI